MTIIHFAIFNLILYSIIGWIIEGVYNYIITGSFKKEGFFYGPYKPMYGIAFTILVMLDKYYNLNLISKLMLYLIIPTSIEFISGYILSSFFNEKYWDYSNSKLNYKGIITLKFSFYWMLLCYIGINFIQPFINNLYTSSEKYFKILNALIGLIIIIDIIATISIKLKLKNSRLLNS